MKAVEEGHVLTAGISHPGEQRSNNEDCFRFRAYQLADGTPNVLAVVSDGIGGHQAGEVASEITVETVFEILEECDESQPLHEMGRAIHAAGERVVSSADMDLAFEGMGSTVSIAWVIGDRLYIAYVGDSRIYLLRNAQIHQISIDHTWLQGALDHHILTPEEAVGHPYGHVLQRAIGSPEPPEADFRLRLNAGETESQSINNQGLQLQAGDQLLLCSDGLTDLVREPEIQEALNEQSPEEAAQSLLSLARARGGHDNITIVILAYVVPIPKPVTRDRRWLPVALLSFLVLIAALVVALFLAWRFNLLSVLGLEWPDAIPNPLKPNPEENVPLLEGTDSTDPPVATTPFSTPSLSPAPTDTAVPLATIELYQP